jgi:hypothetical protein
VGKYFLATSIGVNIALLYHITVFLLYMDKVAPIRLPLLKDRCQKISKRETYIEQVGGGL